LLTKSIKVNMKKNWHDDVFFGLHIDLYANKEDKLLGRDLSVKQFDPDFVQCDCKESIQFLYESDDVTAMDLLLPEETTF
jgi:hypothetical protein